MVAKFVVAIAGAAVFWLIATAINLVGGTLFLDAFDLPNHLGDWSVIRAILLNLVLGGIGTQILRRRDVS